MLPPSPPRTEGKRGRESRLVPSTKTLAFLTQEVKPDEPLVYWHSLQYTVASSAAWNAARLRLTACETERLAEVIGKSAVPYLECEGGRKEDGAEDKENVSVGRTSTTSPFAPRTVKPSPVGATNGSPVFSGPAASDANGDMVMASF
ncbi:hypothetical protein JCM3770_000987 [Rhodotorula araucariae]